MREAERTAIQREQRAPRLVFLALANGAFHPGCCEPRCPAWHCRRLQTLIVHLPSRSQASSFLPHLWQPFLPSQPPTWASGTISSLFCPRPRSPPRACSLSARVNLLHGPLGAPLLKPFQIVSFKYRPRGICGIQFGGPCKRGQWWHLTELQ